MGTLTLIFAYIVIAAAIAFAAVILLSFMLDHPIIFLICAIIYFLFFNPFS